MTNVVVTGGAGFIGTHLVEELVRQSYDVTVIDSFEPQVHGVGTYNPGVRTSGVGSLVIPDRCGSAAGPVKDALKAADIIVHLAAVVGVGQSMYEIAKYVRRNTLDTAWLLESIIQSGRKPRLIVASSMSIYGEGETTVTGKPMATDETKRLEPTSVYAITKRDQEELCLSTGKAYGWPTTALRFFNTYGPGQSLSNPYTGVPAIFASRLRNRKPPVIYGDGSQTRDFIHVSDIVQGIMLALEDYRFSPGEAINLGTGIPTSVRELASFLAGELWPELDRFEDGGVRAGDIQHCYADIYKARHVLGFDPMVGIRDGLCALVTSDWFKEQDAVDNVEQANAQLEAAGLIS